MYTLFLRYTIDPNRLADWKAYAQAEFAPITESGGKSPGITLPPSFPVQPAKLSRPLMSARWRTTRSIAPNLPHIRNIKRT